MVSVDYANAYTEVLCIIKNLAKEDYNKIPKEYIDFFEANCNKDYDFKYDVTIPLNDQEILDDTKYILFGLFEKFGATETQKNKIAAFKKNYNKELEEQKRKKYNPSEIFNNESRDTLGNTSSDIVADASSNILADTSVENKSMIEYKEKNWIQKLFDKILKPFRKK